MSNKGKVISIVTTLVVVVGLIVLIQLNASNSAPVQGPTADPVRGDATATVEIVEYSDFQCPACKVLEPNLVQVLKDFPGQVKLSYNDFPLTTIHDNAQAAAEAGQCALAQNRFWELHDLLFQRQTEWSKVEDPTSTFVNYSVELGMDNVAFQSCLDGDTTLASITEDQAEGTKANISSTPTIFVNGTRMVGPSYDDLYAEVAKQLGE